MGNELDPTLHSAIWFGDTRDYWWNKDFLELMGRRWRLDQVRSLLDVGSGVGHWGRLLHPLLAPGATVTGVDAEPAWAAEAARRAPSDAFRYLHGTAERLPFDDDTFDMVTCQTVLIHVADVTAALREMVRVVKPGGLVATAEPNTFADAQAAEAACLDTPVERIVERLRFVLTCQRGKQALGRGYDLAGELVPRAMAELGLVDSSVYLNDLTATYIPPYASPREQASLRESDAWAERDLWIWPKDDTRRYFLAGGGREDDFEAAWAEARRDIVREAEGFRAQTLYRAGGMLFYVASGRKPG